MPATSSCLGELAEMSTARPRDPGRVYAPHRVALAPALVGVLAYRLFTFWLPIVPAVALLPALRRLGDELDELPRTATVGEAAARA